MSFQVKMIKLSSSLTLAGIVVAAVIVAASSIGSFRAPLLLFRSIRSFSTGRNVTFDLLQMPRRNQVEKTRMSIAFCFARVAFQFADISSDSKLDERKNLIEIKIMKE